ncbi:ferrochelatase [Dunaliella salina]|uniref:Ferrochelatase n=1 Tax=Dunaliella salina TaxID=3046 RepID=A0ABQ7GQQ9_DUNSA|nr:ferrochelatase [Dunaliella salina]|eukprot:KAF5836888.1 ferrochelatase [Dunaliella salina]
MNTSNLQASCSGRELLPSTPSHQWTPRRLTRRGVRRAAGVEQLLRRSTTGPQKPLHLKQASVAAAALSTNSVSAFKPEPAEEQQSVQGGGGNNQRSATDKVGVLLLNLGGPDTLDDVQPFLYNLFADPDIIRLPGAIKFLQPLLAYALSTARAPKSAEGYASIGGGSPLRSLTQKQADALTVSLREKGLNANVYVGMRYWHPYTEEALEQIKRDNVGRLVILPLYPQFSISTSGSSLRLLEKILKEDQQLQGLRHTVIPSWYQRKGYVGAMADLICQELTKFPDPQNVELFFSAHGVPKSYVEEAGDPYKEEMEECISLIVAEVKRRGYSNHHTLAYQSRVGPVEWLQPYTEDSIMELGKNGTKSMLAVPVSFVSEHIETLEEIDMEYRELAEESGIEHWGRVPALNTNQLFIDDLADAVLEALPYVGMVAKPSDASLVPQGELEALLQAYDRERRALPSPVCVCVCVCVCVAETWNGRLAMVALFVIVTIELATGQPILRTILELD